MQPENQASIQEQTSAQNETLQQSKVSKQNIKSLPIIIILTVIAIAGLGFGGYEFWQNSQKDEEVKSLQIENNNLEEQQIIQTEQSIFEFFDENIIGETTDYIYIGKWRMKIKKPENVIRFSFMYSYDTLYMWGTRNVSEQYVGSGLLGEQYYENGEILAQTPFLAKIQYVSSAFPTELGENMGEHNYSGITDDKQLCKNEGTYITNLDIKQDDDIHYYREVLCYKENETLSKLYNEEEINTYIQPTLEEMESNFLNAENYIKL